MATFKKFEDIEAWQQSRELSKKVWKLTCLGTFKDDFGLKQQINKSTGSVMDNIAEGFGRGGNKEFIHFIGISLGSLDETKSQLYRALDREHINQQVFDDMEELVQSIGNKLGKLSSYLNQSDIKGIKFKSKA
jgi:four helix bundle protein